MKVGKKITGILTFVFVAAMLTGCMSSAQLLEQQQNATAPTGAPVTAPPTTAPPETTAADSPADGNSQAETTAESLAEGETAEPTTEAKNVNAGAVEYGANGAVTETKLLSSISSQISKYKNVSWQEIPEIQQADLSHKMGGLPEGFIKAERAKDSEFLELYYVETEKNDIFVVETESGSGKYYVLYTPK